VQGIGNHSVAFTFTTQVYDLILLSGCHCIPLSVHSQGERKGNWQNKESKTVVRLAFSIIV